MQIAICDDDAQERSRIHNRVAQILEEQDIEVAVSVFADGDSFLCHYIKHIGSPFDLILLDIEMPGMNGLELAAKIRKLDAMVLIIFLTAHEQYVYKSFEHSPFRYVPKLHFDSYMPKALHDAYKAVKAEQMKEGYYVAATPQAKTVLPYQTIRHIKKEGRMCVFHLTGGETVSIKKNIKELWTELNHSLFATIHSGCIVNMKYIQQVQKDICVLDNEESFVISRANRQTLRKALHSFWGESH